MVECGVRIADWGLRAVLGHAREAAPEECCGLLLGLGQQIVEAVRARNIADHPDTRFLIDPADHFAALRSARACGLEVVGFYHSHPTSPAEPSARDVAELTYPGHLYAIVSLQSAPAEMRLFRFDSGSFERVPFVAVP